MKRFALTTALALCILVTNASAVLVYDADFSIAGQGATHSGSGTFAAGSAAGQNWELTWPSVATDGSLNEFQAVAGNLMRVQDWGGDGTLTSDNINIASSGTIDIIGVGLSIGGDSFNTVGTEGITWFYTLNGNTTDIFLGETQLGGPVASGTDVGNTFAGVPVSIGDVLNVGFTVNVNGGGDGVEISSLSVDFTPIPEPSAFLFGTLICGVLGWTSARKRDLP